MANKMYLIAQREFLVRVRKKSFLVITVIAPVLLAAVMILPSWLMLRGSDDHFVIGYYDKTGSYSQVLKNDAKTQFVNMSGMPLDSAKVRFAKEQMTGLVLIQKDSATTVTDAVTPKIVHYVSKQQGLEYENRVNKVIEQEVKRRKLEALHLPNAKDVLKSLNADLASQTIILEQGKEKEGSAVLSMGIAYVAGFAIYMAVLIFASMVMRGVIDEKSNRIVEILVSSVKPFDLMMGKIVGIASVGILQFAIWIAMGIAVSVGLQSWMPGSAQTMSGLQDVPELKMTLAAMAGVNWPYLIGCFTLFFVGGYLLYAAMFAMVGSAVDNEADTQQFSLPVTAPLVVALIAMMNTFNSPDSPFAFWMSMIPFTSPVVMMARIPFGVPLWEVALSLVILYSSMVCTVYFAARVYRIGILMYGKKPSYKDLWTWFKFKG